ncbi:CobW family GTP-binding protein [Clostridium paridis]|uniref:GTP-binding protein n=1 Tax=Clostridium paridis TaxID=2803863 RepID=A0A937FH99_9CLOT|nr:GTP-binding protein [Clostridium paridis]MBL4933729.1 GTP-binding protein [Clostridium paridis]
MSIKIDVFSGFLGAGKTKLIKKLIEESLNKEKIAIIENEFGEIGIDGSFLRNSKIEITEISAGCICCSVYGDFKKGILEVIDKYSPERIIIEPSGVAKLSEILSVFKEPDIKEKVSLNMLITVLDVTKYDLYINNFADFYKDQIVNAKTIILSRTQNISKDDVLSLTEKIKKLNSHASIVTTPWSDVSASSIIEIAESTEEVPLLNKINILKKDLGKGILKTSTVAGTKEAFETIGIETPEVYSRTRIESILSSLTDSSKYGLVLRAKGIIETEENNWLEFDYVPGEYEIRTSSADYSGRICVIGNHLNINEVKNLFTYKEI